MSDFIYWYNYYNEINEFAENLSTNNLMEPEELLYIWMLKIIHLQVLIILCQV